MFEIENVEIKRSHTAASPVRDALEAAIMALKPGQSFKVEKKGQLQTARKVAKDLDIPITTSETTLRVGLRPAKE